VAAVAYMTKDNAGPPLAETIFPEDRRAGGWSDGLSLLGSASPYMRSAHDAAAHQRTRVGVGAVGLALLSRHIPAGALGGQRLRAERSFPRGAGERARRLPTR
jgi:hypothetical protein